MQELKFTQTVGQPMAETGATFGKIDSPQDDEVIYRYRLGWYAKSFSDS